MKSRFAIIVFAFFVFETKSPSSVCWFCYAVIRGIKKLMVYIEFMHTLQHGFTYLFGLSLILNLNCWIYNELRTNKTWPYKQTGSNFVLGWKEKTCEISHLLQTNYKT
jgi:inner membrane protein involved in colicin E2 resistance